MNFVGAADESSSVNSHLIVEGLAHYYIDTL